MSQPLISVIIPCYDQAHYLSESIDSILNQTYDNWECIIINDGSSDNTESVALPYTQKDRRIKYFKKENGGLSSARNAGLNESSGNFIQFLDADDVIEPDKFIVQISALPKQANNQILLHAQCAYGEEANIYSETGEKIISTFQRADRFHELIERWEDTLIIPCHSFLFTSDFFLEQGIRFDETLPNHEDFDCWLRILAQDPQVIYNPKVLCRYRQSDKSMSSNMKSMLEGFLKALNKHIAVTSYSKETVSLLKNKKIKVLQSYKRFDLMTPAEKFISWKVLTKFYSKRIKEKLGFKVAQ